MALGVVSDNFSYEISLACAKALGRLAVFPDPDIRATKRQLALTVNGLSRCQ